MSSNTLIRDGDKYGGKYVAIRSFKNKSVVSFGEDAVKVYNEAKKKGVKAPVVFFVPQKGMVNIY